MAALAERSGLFAREVPKVNGSAAAFVALVVVLALIIVVCACGIIWLLLESRRESREPPHRRYQSSTSASRGLEEGAPASSQPKSRIGSTVQRFFRKTHAKKDSGPIEVHTSTRNGQGWVPAAAKSEDDLRARATHAPQMSEVLAISQSPVSTAPPSRNTSPAPQRVHPLDSNGSRLSSMTSFNSTSTRQGSLVAYHDPYAPRPQRTLSSDYSLQSSSITPTSSPSRKNTQLPPSIEQGETEHVYPSRPRLVATQSGMSLRTVDVGSKFFEEL